MFTSPERDESAGEISLCEGLDAVHFWWLVVGTWSWMCPPQGKRDSRVGPTRIVQSGGFADRVGSAGPFSSEEGPNSKGVKTFL